MIGLVVLAAIGTPVGVAILGLVSVISGGLVTALFSRKKTQAEATVLITQAATQMLGELQGQIAGLREEIHQLREEVWRLGGNPNALGERRHASSPLPSHVTVINQPAAVDPIPHLELP